MPEQILSDNELEGLAAQVRSEYNLAWDHQQSKINVALTRLKLYNNQKRDPDKVGDTTLFAILQTVLASLYVDRLEATFTGREEGDEETAENLNDLAENDYDEMGKDELDYYWIWDALFYGRSLLLFQEFRRDPDKKLYLPIPEQIDPATFLRDHRAGSINGERLTGSGAARFMGREMMMTKQEIRDHPHIFFQDFRTIKLGHGLKSLVLDARESRDEAQGRQTQRYKEREAALGENAQYEITEWWTHFRINNAVKKIKVWLANTRSKVIGLQVLKNNYWPIIDRPLYPHSKDWDGTSIPDLTEDKQRARAVAANLGMNMMKADLYPMYVYDFNRVTNKKDLKFNFNKFIPLDGPTTGAIEPIIKARPNLPLLSFIYNSLDISAMRATATPEQQQGVQPGRARTLGELELVSAGTGTRYSLSAKVFGWSAKRFWQQWYYLYKNNFSKSIDEKILALKGAFGPKWRPLKRENIIARIDPDIKIKSKILARAEQLEERQSLTVYFGLLFQEATANRRYGMKKLGKIYGLKKDEIDRLLPATVDERIAEKQNELLNKGVNPPVLPEDDHNVHLEIHSKANDTPELRAHISTHEKALMIKKISPELFPREPEEAAFQPPGTPRIISPMARQPAIMPRAGVGARPEIPPAAEVVEAEGEAARKPTL